MRKFLISMAVATSALAVAAPASAQYAQPQGYGQQGYGYNNNYGQVRVLQARINQIQRQIDQLDRRNILSDREAKRLRNESRDLERRLRGVGRNGLNFRERQNIEVRIARLELQVRREASDGNGRRGGYNNGYGQNGYDRDRDGRDDRYEDDHGTRHDNH
jgi:TolA-binding protein